MNEKIYAISDIEMGRGDIMDDFSDDDMVVRFVEAISKNKKVTLVLNGDIFDFLKMSYKGKYPRYITEEISLWKLEEVWNAHPKVFEALTQFLKNPNHSIFFVIGNHDPDLAWPSLKKEIRKKLECENRIDFGYQYGHKDIHAEHGHLQDPFFNHKTRKPIVTFRGKKILNLPWGAQAVFSHLVHLKKKYPKEECMFPNPLALKQNKAFESESKKTTFRLALRSLFLDPIIHIGDPTYKVPYWGFAKHLLFYGSNFVDDEKFVKRRAHEVMQSNPSKKVFLLGHAHLVEKIERAHRKVLVTDTWRNEYNLNKNGAKKPKTYARIEYEGDEIVSTSLETYEDSERREKG